MTEQMHEGNGRQIAKVGKVPRYEIVETQQPTLCELQYGHRRGQLGPGEQVIDRLWRRGCAVAQIGDSGGTSIMTAC